MTQQESTQLKLLAIDSAIKIANISTSVDNVHTHNSILEKAKEINKWLIEEPIESKIVKLS